MSILSDLIDHINKKEGPLKFNDTSMQHFLNCGLAEIDFSGAIVSMPGSIDLNNLSKKLVEIINKHEKP